MKASLPALLLFCFLSGDFVYGQSPSIDKVRFLMIPQLCKCNDFNQFRQSIKGEKIRRAAPGNLYYNLTQRDFGKRPNTS